MFEQLEALVSSIVKTSAETMRIMDNASKLMEENMAEIAAIKREVNDLTIPAQASDAQLELVKRKS